MRPARVRVWRSEVFTHHWWIDYYGTHGYLIDSRHRPTHAAALAHALAAVGLAPEEES
ncbi:hypothetical protein Bra3105_06580 [Brachybacterium halotolerans subsp. kimchii]|uniref:hypothetical protein n=1 Tax=Brachybacterium halotolerans TaxID=2795215 RepID=UPI001E2B6E87|nr:hypothetical protein [Brachybacterium halotolerans]UEJ83972.1 hypothetical protein Bra3105_06580 [Brachybacterium halotolerans subsp. kimchii]